MYLTQPLLNLLSPNILGIQTMQRQVLAFLKDSK